MRSFPPSPPFVMRADTKTSLFIIDGAIRITVDPAIAARPNLDKDFEAFKGVLCRRCIETIFSPLTWAHLRGETLNVPGPPPGDSDYHILDDKDGNVIDEEVQEALGPLADDDTFANPSDDRKIPIKQYNARACSRRRGPMRDFNVTAKDIFQSRHEGCAFCSMLVPMDAHNSILSDPEKSAILRLQAFWPEKANGIWEPILLQFGLHPDQNGGGEVAWLALIDEQKVAPLLWSDSTDPNVLDLTGLMNQIKAWLRHCEREHAMCAHAGSQMPTRVLDLDCCTAVGQVHLIESKDINSGPFAVLSYKWGTRETMRLVEDNRAAYMAGISISELPDTIRQAVNVANAIGIRYLWVDSLCILQDSDLDKRMEIPRLNQYYRTAHVVISASGATSVHEGFLHHQRRSQYIYANIARPGSERFGSRLAHVNVPLRIPGYFADHSTTLLADVAPHLYQYSGEPINQRAWTLEESVLPRRLITFPSTSGVSMRCLHGEAYAADIISDPYHEAPAYCTLGSISSVGHDSKQIVDLWFNMVQDYTQRSLTHQKDILIAIDALAKEFENQYRTFLGRYIAGLWEKHLLAGLLWYFDSRQPLPSKSPNYAPSWSWASISRPIKFHNEPEDYLPSDYLDKAKPFWLTRWLCKVLSIEGLPQSVHGIFTVGDKGVVKLQGSLVPIQGEKLDRDLPPSHVDANEYGLPDLGPEGTDNSPNIFLMDNAPAAGVKSDQIDTSPYLWFPIWYAGRGRGRGLIVEHIGNTRYRRVGYAQYSTVHNDFSESNSIIDLE